MVKTNEEIIEGDLKKYNNFKNWINNEISRLKKPIDELDCLITWTQDKVKPIKLIIPNMASVSVPFDIWVSQFDEPIKASYKYIYIENITSRYGSRTCYK